MKSKILLVLFVFAGAYLTSCDNDDIHPWDLPKTVQEYIALNYPSARIVESDFDHGYYDVDIIDGTDRRELIFNSDGEWVSTETDITLANIPEIVKATIASSEYSEYRIDDVDYFETPSGDYYYIELELKNKEVDVKITPDGNLEVIRVSKD